MPLAFAEGHPRRLDMATPRAYWKGYLKLSLVTCPVSLFPASSQSEKTHFHQINRKTGNRLRQQMVDEETGRVVDKEDKGRGYDLGNGKYVEIEPEELEAVEIESTHTIDIDKFVPEEDIDKRYYERPYYIVPDEGGEEAFAVIRDAMKDKGRVALARIVFAHREHILAVEGLGQRNAGNDAALRLRSARREAVFQWPRKSAHHKRYDRPRKPHPRQEGRPVRCLAVQRRIRARAPQARQAESRRQDDRASGRTRGPRERYRSHGSLAPEREDQGQQSGVIPPQPWQQETRSQTQVQDSTFAQAQRSVTSRSGKRNPNWQTTSSGICSSSMSPDELGELAQGFLR
jgi:Ku70/Ku80 beta-barrel domain